ncbi:50S ribosomal protein L6 [Gottschalkia acidurici 9a]|uniref:Large ribosomal subunit protein uL6 n=1 Tax=Gottschalkia acidurici (strain ATCC 7906 / DSM 604 / BCRC 14475 / CIP 104303 / KCTC 5404 / NCIMB 10678 / 9a) TaxID=1128398 RepID=K0B3T9_GOTA9|nr:50S ribosomal protein L6 [Gottschalkia acidurici]AFS79251.1 50S ribosomal protein L6 [Gottschalkia acidurici 9a]
MSRIGLKPITVPAGVEVSVDASNKVVVKGPKGTLEQQISKDLTINREDDTITVARPTDRKEHRALHGLSRTLIANMIEGVTNGYTKALDIVGVGYRAQKQGNKLVLNLGFSHPIEMEDPQGISVEVPTNTKIIVSGINKEQVGNYAAIIRELRKPEPYKGKGVRYENEVVRRKEGKTGK